MYMHIYTHTYVLTVLVSYMSLICAGGGVIAYFLKS